MEQDIKNASIMYIFNKNERFSKNSIAPEVIK